MSTGGLSSQYRTALVTGASTGLGKAFVAMLLAEGVEVWGTARELSRVPDRPGFHGVALELGDGAAVERIFRQAEQAAGGFDIVINNAGYGAFGEFAQTDFTVWERHLQVMLVNTARLGQIALRGMLARGRRAALVNISSLAAEFSLPYQASYNVVKAGLSALSESLMYEVKGTPVAVIDFRPGDFRTDFEQSLSRPASLRQADAVTASRLQRVWETFSKLMQSGPSPEVAAGSLRRALRRGQSGTIRTGRFFQAVLAPLLARWGTLAFKRRVQERYFSV